MNDTDLIRLASRIKARTRDLEVLKLCDGVLAGGVTSPSSPPVTSPSPVTSPCPFCSQRRELGRERTRRWRRKAGA